MPRPASYWPSSTTSESEPARSAAWPRCPLTLIEATRSQTSLGHARRRRACPVFSPNVRSTLGEGLIAPVEVARLATPEAVLEVGARRSRVLDRRSLLAGPRTGWADGRLAVHGLFETCLLLGLEERMVLERVFGLVDVQRHPRVERGVLLLEREMFLDRLCKQRGTFN